MKSKPSIHNLTIGLFVLVIAACNSDDTSPLFENNYNERERELITDLVPALEGTWQLEQISISFTDDWNQQEGGITSDTIFRNVGALTINNCSNAIQPQYPDCQAIIMYQNEAIPVQFGITAAPERVVRGTGEYAYISITLNTTNLPDNYDWEQPEMNFFRNINFINEGFAIAKVDADTMVWHGLNATYLGLDSVRFARISAP